MREKEDGLQGNSITAPGTSARTSRQFIDGAQADSSTAEAATVACLARAIRRVAQRLKPSPEPGAHTLGITESRRERTWRGTFAIESSGKRTGHARRMGLLIGVITRTHHGADGRVREPQ